MPRKLFGVVAVLGLLLSLAACGSSDKAASDGAIKVMAMGTFQAPGYAWADASAAVEAKAKEVNDKGGVNGHKIEVIVCDDQQDPNQATACARKAVSEGVVAVISSTQTTGFGAQTIPILQAAGIPVVGQPTVGEVERTSENVYTMDAGSAAQYSGVALALKRAGCTKVASLQMPLPAAITAVELLESGLKAVGSTLVKNIKVAMSETSYAPQVAQIISAGAQCIVPIIVAPETAKLIQTVKQSGEDLTIGGVTGAFSQEMLTSLGDAANGIVLAGGNYLPTDTEVPAVKAMLDALAKYEPSVTVGSTFSTNAWGAAVFLFDGVFPGVDGDFTAKSVTAAIQATKDAPAGTYGTYTYNIDPPNPDLPRVRRSGVLLWQVQGGVPKLTSEDYINIYDALKAGS